MPDNAQIEKILGISKLVMNSSGSEFGAMRERIEQAGGNSFEGYVRFCSPTKLGEFDVSFHDESSNKTLGGSWPEWAFQQAQQALLNNKKIWVVTSGGEPGLDNIVAVYVRNLMAENQG